MGGGGCQSKAQPSLDLAISGTGRTNFKSWNRGSNENLIKKNLKYLIVRGESGTRMTSAAAGAETNKIKVTLEEFSFHIHTMTSSLAVFCVWYLQLFYIN